MASSKPQVQKPAPKSAPALNKALPDISSPTTAPATTDQPKAEKAKAPRKPWRTAIKLAEITLTPDTRVVFNESAYNAKPKRGAAQRRLEMVYKTLKLDTVGKIETHYAEQKKAGAKDYVGSTSARSNLNWDFQHGFVTFEAPKAS